jgi:dTDP-4-dehydrorhamnose reductase
MRILLFGASGHVGRLLLAALRGHDARGLSRNDADLRDRAAVERAVSEVRPDAVILAAGIASADACEDRPGDAYAINVDGARNAAEASRGRAFIHFSTDHVFDGKGGPYSEEDATAPLSVYGRTKLESERVVSAVNPRSLIVRTTLVYSLLPGLPNFLTKILEARAPVPCWTDHLATYTYGPNLAEAVVEMLERGFTGLWHLAGPGLLNRHEFALKVAARFGLDASLFKPVSIRDAPPRAPRPLRAGLRVEKAQAALRTRLLSVDEALALMPRDISPGTP